ncbi:MAG TPA: tetratricopeptide repeat protein [Candidatus Sulfomarinibacteraceae bacterium]|nr:tetratricopeptide repeat protein [Candidatus Sulfomarinibacteraceae bacterium]
MKRHLSLLLLGAFQVKLNGESLDGFDYDKVRALLAYLAVERDVPQRRDALTSLLWPEQPTKAARHSLSQALLKLRQALGDRQAEEPFILADRKTIRLNPQAKIELDVTQFEAHLAACDAHQHTHPSACAECMEWRRQAIELYGGDFLQGLSLPDAVAFDDWTALTRERLHRMAIDVLHTLARFHEGRGEARQARRYAARQVELEPWREEAHRQLMRLLARSGQRSAALLQYERCCQILDAELGVAPAPQTRRLYERIRAAGSGRAGNLPTPPTPFIGRQQEVADVAGMLAQRDCRLVTLLGPGGVGKTRLALEVAARKTDWFLDGVTFVPLVAAETETEMVNAIADALAFSFASGDDGEKALLLDYLSEKEMLLVLDNFEHLQSGVPFLSTLMEQAPGVSILITARIRTSLSAEWVYEVEGFPTPAHADLETSEAAQLFAQAAQRVRKDFSLATTDREAVVRICRMVEGVPLALELAASWTRLLTAREIAGKVESGPDFLTTLSADVPQRHQSMRAVFEQTWRLLAEQEREALCRLAVFRGGFTQEAAAHTGAAPLRVLAGLMDKSLLQRIGDERYGVHELLRQYALDKLAGRDDGGAAHAAHAAYYARFLQEREAAMVTGKREEALRDIDREIENVRRAWQWLVGGGKMEEIGQCLHALSLFYELQNWFQEGAKVFTAAAAQVSAQDSENKRLLARLKIRQSRFHLRLAQHEQAQQLLAESMDLLQRLEAPSEQALALRSLAAVASKQGAFQTAEEYLRHSLRLYQQLHDEAGVATAQTRLGAARHQQGDYETARTLYKQSLEQFEALGDSWGVGAALHRMGHLAYELGEYDEARRFYAQRLEIARATGDRRGAAASFNNLGNVYYARGNYKEAERHYLQGLAAWQELGNRWGTALAYNNLGLIATEREAYADARRCFQDSLALCRAIGDKRGIALALNNLGELASQQNALDDAREYHEESLALFREIGQPRGIMYALNFLGTVEANSGARAAATTYYREALQLALAHQAAPRALDSLAGLAVVLHEDGETQQAAEILALVLDAPATEEATRERAEALLNTIDSILPGEQLAAARRRGRQADWQTAATRLLQPT